MDALSPGFQCKEVRFADLDPFKESEANQCRYIPAINPGPDYIACGRPTLPGESWCGFCRDIVFVPKKDRR